MDEHPETGYKELKELQECPAFIVNLHNVTTSTVNEMWNYADLKDCRAFNKSNHIGGRTVSLHPNLQFQKKRDPTRAKHKANQFTPMETRNSEEDENVQYPTQQYFVFRRATGLMSIELLDPRLIRENSIRNLDMFRQHVEHTYRGKQTPEPDAISEKVSGTGKRIRQAAASFNAEKNKSFSSRYDPFSDSNTSEVHKTNRPSSPRRSALPTSELSRITYSQSTIPLFTDLPFRFNIIHIRRSFYASQQPDGSADSDHPTTDPQNPLPNSKKPQSESSSVQNPSNQSKSLIGVEAALAMDGVQLKLGDHAVVILTELCKALFTCIFQQKSNEYPLESDQMFEMDSTAEESVTMESTSTYSEFVDDAKHPKHTDKHIQEISQDNSVNVLQLGLCFGCIDVTFLDAGLRLIIHNLRASFSNQRWPVELSRSREACERSMRDINIEKSKNVKEEKIAVQVLIRIFLISLLFLFLFFTTGNECNFKLFVFCCCFNYLYNQYENTMNRFYIFMNSVFALSSNSL